VRAIAIRQLTTTQRILASRPPTSAATPTTATGLSDAPPAAARTDATWVTGADGHELLAEFRAAGVLQALST
jgi:hypothetical protein